MSADDTRLVAPIAARLVETPAPATRLATFRIALGAFITLYVVARLPVFLELATRSSRAFEPVGVVNGFGSPWPSAVVVGLVWVTIASGLAFAVGWRFRLSGPLLSVSVLALTTYRSSWGQLLHFENLFVLLAIVVACSPAADAWSLDARRRAPRTDDETLYGWVLELCCWVVVTTYLVAGIAKLRYGGLDWVIGDTLENHIAYSAARLELLGGAGAPLAEWAIRHAWMLVPMATATVVIELGAPLVMFWRQLRAWWCAAAWAMHIGIFGLMLIGFPTPLFGVAFLPFFRCERLVRRT